MAAHLAAHPGRAAVGTGAIPNNVSVATGRLDHTNAGSVDSNLWYIVGHYVNYQITGDCSIEMEG